MPQLDRSREAATEIVKQLRDAGFAAYFAGGCVRDRLLGLAPTDYDIATDARPNQVGEHFHTTQYVGESFGVVLVRLMGQQIQVATFRKEWDYQDGRHPTGVAFTDAENDALRRDFTINGLFEDPLTEQIIDYVDGQVDLAAKIIRSIGDPSKRFSEDYLRLLRAVRFASRLGFEIETLTSRAIRNHARYLGQISRERIGQEVLMMLQEPKVNYINAIQLLENHQLDGPTLNEDHRKSALKVSLKLSDKTDYPTRLAAWLIDRHLGDQLPQYAKVVEIFQSQLKNKTDRPIKQWRRALSLSNEHVGQLRETIALAIQLLNWPQLSKAKHKRLLARPRWRQSLALLEAIATTPLLIAIIEKINIQVADLLHQNISPIPFVRGEDLIMQGLIPGPHFRGLLDQVYDQQLEDQFENREQALIWLQQLLAEQT